MATGRRTLEQGTEPDVWAASIAGVESGSSARSPSAQRRILVVGGGRIGRHVASRLASEYPVHHLDADPAVAASSGVHEASHAEDVTAPAAIAATGVTNDDTAIVLTGRDGSNLLVVQQLRLRFGLDRIVVVLAEPRNREAFDLPGVEVVCPGETLGQAVLGSIGDAVSEPPTGP